MPLPLPPRNLNPIPNDPFYYPQDDAVSSSTGPLVIGAGLAVQYDTGTLVASGGGLANVTAQLPLYKIGVETNPTFAVETANRVHLGVVQVGENIDLTPAGIISVATGSTTRQGIVQLADTTASTSSNLALAARQGYLLQQQINGLAISNDLTFSGVFNAATSQLTEVTEKGQLAGFVVGQNLPLPDPTINGYFVIIGVGGSYVPPNGSSAFDTLPGSWLVVLNGAWRYVKLREPEPYATTTDPGVVRLATFNEAIDTTINNLAITPASMASATVERTAYGVKGDLLVAQSAADPIALPIGTDGQVLTACAADAGGMRWTNAADDIPCSTITSCGSIVVGVGPQTPGELTPGSQNQYLRVNYCCPQALEWVTVCNNFSIPCSVLTNAGGLVTASAPGQPIPLPRGANCQILTVDTAATATGGLAWKDNPAILKSSLESCPRGSVVTTDAGGAVATQPGPALDPASNGLALTYSNTSTTGLVWAEASPPQSCFTTKGQLYVGTGNQTLCALPVGGNGQVVTADANSPSGVIWATPTPTCVQHLSGTIWTGVEILSGDTFSNCDWLRGPGDPQNLALGNWMVTVYGDFTEGRAGCSYGQFCVTWWDQNGGVAGGPGVCYAVDGVTVPYSYSVIANNSYCCCGLYWNWRVDSGRTRTSGIDAYYTAVFLGGNG